MPKPFYTRLKNYFSDIAKVLQGQSSVASIFPNTTDVGMSRERIYAEVLRQHIPASCAVYYGGFLFDIFGNESKQIDLIVNNDKALQFNFHNPNGSGKSFACIDGCVAIASIKSYLSSEELIDALKNISSIPDKQPLDGRVNPLFKIDDYDDWPLKIVYAINGVSIETCYNTLNSFYAHQPEIPLHKRPNIIHVAGKYWLFRCWTPVTSSNGITVQIGDYLRQEDSTDVFALLYSIISIQKIAQKSNQLTYNYNALLDNAAQY